MNFLPTLKDAVSIMQILTGISLIALTLIVYFHQRKNDKELLRNRAWETQQQINYMALREDKVLRASELVLSGNFDAVETIDDIKRAVYICFIQINRIHSLWHGSKSGLLSKSEVLDEVRPTLRLLLGSPEIFNYCLTRGYAGEFAKFMETERDHVLVNLAKPESGNIWATTLLSKIKANKASTN